MDPRREWTKSGSRGGMENARYHNLATHAFKDNETMTLWVLYDDYDSGSIHLLNLITYRSSMWSTGALIERGPCMSGAYLGMLGKSVCIVLALLRACLVAF